MKPDPFKQSILEVERDFQSHRLFATETLSLLDKATRVIPYNFAPGPSKMQKAADHQRSKGKPIRLISLKARQVFISTWVASLFVHETAFSKGQKAFVVSHEAKSAANIHSYYEQFLSSYQPFRGIVKMLPWNTVGYKTEFEGGGFIDIATANNLKSGRSFSIRHLHLSEYAFYKDATTLMRGLANAVPDDPMTCIVKESTANGVGGAFYNDWLEASDPSSGSDWIAVFLGYWEHPEYVRRPEHRAAFQDSLTREEEAERTKYHLSLDQLCWRRWAIQNKCRGSVDTFRQEFPGNPEEAFLMSGRPRFSHEHLARMPIIAAPLVGELEAYQLGPKRMIAFNAQEKGALTIYKKPAAGRLYVMGIDVCEGIDVGEGTLGGDDPDWTVFQVLDRDTGEQVAKVRMRMWPASAAEYCALLAEYYNWCYVVPERNGPGIAFIDGLLREGYPEGLIFHGHASPAEPVGDRAEFRRLGWNTDQTSRVQLISGMDQAIREIGVIVRDAHTLQELRTFVIHPNGKAKAQNGCHDDEVLALALANIGVRFAPMDTRLNALHAQGAQLHDPSHTWGKSRLPSNGGETESRGTLRRL